MLKRGRVQEFSHERHGIHFLDIAERFHIIHKGDIISKTTTMTPEEIVASLQAADAAQIASSAATTAALQAAEAAVTALPTGTTAPSDNTVTLAVGDACTTEDGQAGTMQDDGTGALVCTVTPVS